MVLFRRVLQSVFKESLLRVFKKWPADMPGDGGHLQMGFAATFEVRMQRKILLLLPLHVFGVCIEVLRKCLFMNDMPEGADKPRIQGGGRNWPMFLT